VGNPNFAIIDEAYPYIARRLMTDKSPRLRAALRYMVYGRDDQFDAENLIDMLQALEKFSAVRNDGDGSAFKVDGVRGGKVLGSAGDFSGSQVVDISDRDTDIDGGRFRVSKSTSAGALAVAQPNVAVTESVNDERTVREALRFFFSQEGEVFRDFMLEEIVTVVDASGRDAVQELVRRVGLANFPVPSFIRALNPELSAQDKRVSAMNIHYHVKEMTLSNIFVFFHQSPLCLDQKQTVQQIQKLVQFLLGDFEGSASTARLRKLVPVAREYALPLRDFGVLLAARLTEKSISRGMNWASERLQRADMDRASRRGIIERAM
jgi:aarF domain-containing kinase